ncbi:MAG: hypothetical protein QF805_04095 [Pirellulaceae bacterium]|nr:hypothetical protein [Pirellulaceae bacterium]
MNDRRSHPACWPRSPRTLRLASAKKLDRDTEAAKEWQWSAADDTWRIDADGNTVSLNPVDGLVSSVDHVGCSCLLTPRCFHLLSVLSQLDLGEEAGEDLEASEVATSDSAASDGEDVRAEVAELGDDQRAAAESMWRSGAAMLAGGARSAGSLVQAALLRDIHQCRKLGLHRLGSSALRVVQNSRQLRADSAGFNSHALIGDLTDMLETAWRLKDASKATPHFLGIARRAYVPAGNLRLQGLFTEPLLTRSGYSGVVTYLIDESSQIYTLSNVRPGGVERLREAWGVGIDLGGLSISHRQTCRSGFIVQHATTSDDGRLGAGKKTKAATCSAEGWSGAGASARFAEPWEQQVRRVYDALPTIPELRPAGWDLLFLRGRVVGLNGHALVLDLGDGQLALTAAMQGDMVHYRRNLEWLGRAPGMPLLAIARLATGLRG